MNKKSFSNLFEWMSQTFSDGTLIINGDTSFSAET